MRETVADLQTQDGLMNTFVFNPDGEGPFPVVIFYMDSVGVREELSDMCRRLATVGYYVIMPNLYYRLVRCVDLDANRLRDPAYEDSIALLWKLNKSLSNTMIERDTQSLYDLIDKEPTARGGKVGIVGYCMSGRFVFRMAGAFPDRVAASASVYGAGLVSDQSHSAKPMASKSKGEMYFACAEHDHYITEEVIARLRSIIDETGIKGSIEFYPEAEHGFAFPSRRLYHKASTERHWERLFAMFRRTL